MRILISTQDQGKRHELNCSDAKLQSWSSGARTVSFQNYISCQLGTESVDTSEKPKSRCHLRTTDPTHPQPFCHLTPYARSNHLPAGTISITSLTSGSGSSALDHAPEGPRMVSSAHPMSQAPSSRKIDLTYVRMR
jgi:hypothetical protein